MSPSTPRAARGLSTDRPNPRDARLEHSAERLLATRSLLPEKGALLVAVSGGPDSVALLHFLRDYHTRTGLPPGGIAVGHVDHGLRGSESDADAAFVGALGRSFGLAVFEERIDPLARRRSRGESLEQAARALRYGALRGIAERAGADRIAVAHTVDDQAETVLLRLIRGAGLRGLSGMPVRGRVEGARIVRPLLSTTRERVLEYLARHGISYRTDSSNAEPTALRNVLRMEILPRIRARMNPSVDRALVREADAFREADAYLLGEARRLLPEVVSSRAPGKISVDAARVLEYPNVLRTYLFRCALQELNGDLRDLSKAHIDALLSLLRSSSGRSADIPMGLRARRERGQVVLERRDHEPARPRGPSKA